MKKSDKKKIKQLAGYVVSARFLYEQMDRKLATCRSRTGEIEKTTLYRELFVACAVARSKWLEAQHRLIAEQKKISSKGV